MTPESIPRLLPDGTLDVPVAFSQPQLAFMNSPAKYTFFRAGFGAGKSFAGTHKVLLRCNQNPGMNGMLVSSTYGRMSRDVLPTLFSLLDSAGVSHEWIKPAVAGTPPRALLIGKGWLNSIVHIGSMDNPDSLKGPNLAWINGDEAALFPRNVPGKAETTWAVLISRLRVQGATNTVDLTGTPEGMGNWTNDPGMFGVAPTDSSLYAEWARDYQVVQASTGSNTHLPAGFVRGLENALDPQQRLEKIHGQPASGVKGACYYEWRPWHVDARVRYHPLRGPVHVGIDFNVGKMCAVLMQHWRDCFTVFDEVILRDSNTRALASAVKKRLELWKVPLEQVETHPDASGRSRKTTGPSDHAVLMEEGLVNLRFSPSGNPLVADRRNAVNGALYHRRFFVAPRCGDVVRDCTQLAVDDAGEILKTSELSHSTDAAGYVVEHLAPVRRPSTPGIGLV